MLIYFKKEKDPQLDIIKIKLKNITIANSQESKHIKTNLRKKIS
jgi:general stress protein 26